MTADMTIAGTLNMNMAIRSPRMCRPGETIIDGEYQRCARCVLVFLSD